jgi:LmbE family N-acetylglucosaminyl deacetylase
MARKVIFGIFAHPDDEAFGPSGTFLMETAAGNDVHLVTLTLGDAGTNVDDHPDLAAVREKEWRRAGKLMGAKSMTSLGFHDGQLNNLAMMEIQEKLLALIKKTVADELDDIEIELLSTDTNGISGHIDHIVAGRAAAWVFYRLKEIDPRVTRLRLATVPKSQMPTSNTRWLYMEAGRDELEIGETVDARAYRATIIKSLRAHHSLRLDGENHIKNRGDTIGLNYFIVKT